MKQSLIQHLNEMGIIASNWVEELSNVADTRHEYLVKGYFSDPRDGNREVPF